MPSSTWTWIGGTGSADISSNWTLAAGPGNAQHLPQPGDTSIINTGTAGYLDPGITGGSTIELTGSGAAQFINDSTTASNAMIDATSAIDSVGPATALQIEGPVTSNGVIEVSGTHDSLGIAIASNGVIAGDLINSNTGTVLVAQGDSLSITGTGEFINSGSFDVVGGSAVIASLLGGVGAYAVNSGGSLEFAQPNAGATEVIDMTGGAGLVKFDNAALFSGSIHNFVVGDRIDVGPVNVATLTYDAGGHLQLFDSGGSLLFSGLVSGSGGSPFQIGSFPVSPSGGIAGGFRVSQFLGGDAVVSVQGPSTWTWFGGSGSAANAANWSFTAGSGNPSGIPGIGDTALVNAGTVQALDTQFNANTLLVGSATGQFSNDTTVLRTATFDSVTTIESAASAVSTVLQTFGLVLNDGSVLAASAGGGFTLSAQQFAGGSLLPGLFVNAGEVGASNGDTLTITTGANAAFANVGSVLADGGLVRVAGSLAGANGVWDMAQGGTVEIGAAPSSASFVFGDATGTLELDQPALFGAAILAFQAGDTINLGHVAVGTIAYDGADGVLGLINAGSTVASLRVSGNFLAGSTVVNGGTAGSFTLGTDGSGNTILSTTTVRPVSWTFGSDDWSVTSDWSTKSLPGGNDTALFGASASSRTITVSTPASAGTLLMEDANTNLQVTSGLSIAGSVDELGGTIGVTTGAELTAQSIDQIGDASRLAFAITGNNASVVLTGAHDIADVAAGPVGLIDTGSVTVAHGLLDAGGQSVAGTTGGYVAIGMDGSPSSPASMTVQSGGTVFATYTRIDSDVTSAGSLSISDPGSSYTDVGDVTDAANTRGYLLVGINSGSLTPIGGATLHVLNGATLTETSYAEIGANAGSNGTATIASGAQWLIGVGSGQPGFLVVGDGGAGTLSIGDLPGTIASGGTVAVGSGGTIVSSGTKIVVPYAVDIGLAAGSSGAVTVSGAGALLTAQNDVRVGDAGSGTLTVGSGGTAHIASGSLIVGGGNGGSDGGSGVVAIASGGSLSADTNLFVWQGSTVSADATSAIDIGGSSSLTTGAMRIESGHSLVGVGMIEAAVINSGQIIASTSGNPASSTAGTLEITGSVTGGGGIGLGSGASLRLDATLAVAQSVTFDAGAPETLIIGTPGTVFANLIQNLSAGDRIEFGGGMMIDSAGFAGGTITVNTGGAPYLLTNAGFAPGAITGLTTGTDATTGDAFIQVACFMVGTHIGAEHADVPVETLRVGDRVRVAIGASEVEAVIWIGHRRIDCRRHPRPSLVWPVRIATGAFGPGLPRRDLWLSPDHAVYLADVLIPVKYLINGSSIVQVPMDAVTYHHVELSRHSVLLAEALPVESYLDVGDRTAFGNGSDPIALYPDFASHRWEAEGCAPLVVTGWVLEAARRRVNVRAAGARRSRKVAPVDVRAFRRPGGTHADGLR